MRNRLIVDIEGIFVKASKSERVPLSIPSDLKSASRIMNYKQLIFFKYENTLKSCQFRIIAVIEKACPATQNCST